MLSVSHTETFRSRQRTTRRVNDSAQSRAKSNANFFLQTLANEGQGKWTRRPVGTGFDPDLDFASSRLILCITPCPSVTPLPPVWCFSCLEGDGPYLL